MLDSLTKSRLLKFCENKLPAATVEQELLAISRTNAVSVNHFPCWLQFFHKLSHSTHKSFYEKMPKFFKRQVYLISLFYNRILFDYGKDSSYWYTKLTDHIYLGALPLEKHLGVLKKEKIQRVLSMVESFERLPSLVARPLSRESLRDHQIKNDIVPASDFFSISLADLHQGVSYISEAVDNKERLYVHCKAGRGRSAAVVIAYLSTYAGMSFHDAFALVKSKRPTVRIVSKKKNLLFYYHLYSIIEKQEKTTKHWEYLQDYIAQHC